MSELNEATRTPRERKQVQRIEVSATVSKDKSLTIPSGSGVSLGEYEYFVEGLKKLKSDDEVCKTLHTLMFGGPGQNTQRKANLRKFSGFATGVDLVAKRDKLIAKKSLNVSDLKACLSLLGCERSGTREDLIKRVVEYLNCPNKAKREGSSVNTKKRKRTSKDKSSKVKKNAKPSGYITFVKAKRVEVKEANPEASFGELGKLLGALWNANSAEEKAMWVAKAHAEAADSEGVAATNYEDSDSDTESDNEETGLFTEQEETEASGAV